MRLGFWLMFGQLGLAFSLAAAEEPVDSLAKGPDSTGINIESAVIYVIPAGPVAGSFTDQSRVQVVDTVAGWAKVFVEGWVPVEKVIGRMGDNAVVLQQAEIEKPKKVKAERPQCVATTAKGKRCSRKAIAGSKKCWQHSQ